MPYYNPFNFLLQIETLKWYCERKLKGTREYIVRKVISLLFFISPLMAQEDTGLPTPFIGNQPELVAPTPPVMETPQSLLHIKQEEKAKLPESSFQSGPTSMPGKSLELSFADPGTTHEHEPDVNIGLSREVREKTVQLLNKLLIDEYILYTKTLKFHWAVKGIVFHDFHKMFKQQYKALFKLTDTLAERAQAIDPEQSQLDPNNLDALASINAQSLSALQMAQSLLADHESIIRAIRKAIDTISSMGDAGTANILQDAIIMHEKLAWMLRATTKNN
jgi:starvation-inducible DNA-binding protein